MPAQPKPPHMPNSATPRGPEKPCARCAAGVGWRAYGRTFASPFARCACTGALPWARIVPLALAIGCTAAVFSLVDAVLFRPTGVANASRVAAVYTFSRAQNRYLSDSYPDFRDIRALDGVLESAAAYIRTQVNVRLTEGIEPMNAEMVTGDYFRAAGITPALGRPLVPKTTVPARLPSP